MSSSEGDGARERAKVRPVGARFHMQREPGADAPEQSPSAKAEHPRFQIQLRGYDRGQVDRYVAEAEAERGRFVAERARILDELAELSQQRRAAEASGTPKQGGMAQPPHEEIEDMLLRAARRQALQIRAQARQDAASIMAAAHAEANQVGTARSASAASSSAHPVDLNSPTQPVQLPRPPRP